MLVAPGHNMGLGFGFGGLGNNIFMELWLWEVLLTRLGWIFFWILVNHGKGGWWPYWRVRRFVLPMLEDWKR